MGGGRWAPLILCRKYMRCCALLTSDTVFTDQVSLSVIYTPKNLVLLATSTTVLWLRSGTWLGRFFLKSRRISFILFTFKISLLFLLQPTSCSSCIYRPGHCCPWWNPILGDAFMCHQSEQQRTQDTALKRVRAEGDDTGSVLSDLHGLVAHWGSLVTSISGGGSLSPGVPVCLPDVVEWLNAELESWNNRNMVVLLQMCEA